MPSSIPWIVVSLLTMLLISRSLYTLPLCFRERPKPQPQSQNPPQLPYRIPLVVNIITFLRAPHQLAFSITQKFGKSGVVRLSFFTRDVYVVSGAEYLKAVWKDTKGMSSCDGLNVALRNMFNTPRKDMTFIKQDRSGISHDPHPLRKTKPEDRVFHHAFKSHRRFSYWLTSC